MADITELTRTFRYNSVDLPDPGAQYNAEQVRDFYAGTTYPELASAAVEGPEEKDGKLVWTFRKAVGTKGNAGRGVTIVINQSALDEAFVREKLIPALKAAIDEQPATIAPDRLFISIGVGLIAAERLRQVEQEGWDAEHDDEHANGSMARAAACYAANAGGHDIASTLWPWGLRWSKPKDQIRDLARAGALTAAEIDRLNRAQARG